MRIDNPHFIDWTPVKDEVVEKFLDDVALVTFAVSQPSLPDSMEGAALLRAVAHKKLDTTRTLLKIPTISNRDLQIALDRAQSRDFREAEQAILEKRPEFQRFGTEWCKVLARRVTLGVVLILPGIVMAHLLPDTCPAEINVTVELLTGAAVVAGSCALVSGMTGIAVIWDAAQRAAR